MGKSVPPLVVILCISCMAFIPCLNLIAGWPVVEAPGWGAAISAFFEAVDRIGGVPDGSIGMHLWVFLFFFGLSLILVPVVLSGAIVLVDDMKMAKKRSMVTEGEVKESNLQESDDIDGTVYRPEITYQFRVDGKKHTNTCGVTRGWSNDMKQHEKTLKMFSRGVKITIYYEPANCDNNALRKWTTGSWIGFCFKITLLSILYGICAIITGTFLDLFIKSFIENAPGIQLISSAALAAVVLGFVFFARYYFGTTLKKQD